MSLCINPTCSRPDHPSNRYNTSCQSCWSELLLQNRYRVMQLLSDDSGFGDVYEASDNITPKILKVLQARHNQDPKVVDLFRQEARVLKALSHSGIPAIDGYFEFMVRPGVLRHCIVMEKVDGMNLLQWMELQFNKPISESRAIAWLRQIAEILDLVHQKQWFHRDLKPGNIMLRQSGQLVLIDFGNARQQSATFLAKQGAGYASTLVIGSKGYMPPEQIAGYAVPQSDFFALGRTMAHLLTGTHPFYLYDPHLGELRWRQEATVSPALADFLDRLMAQRPSDRPADTAQLSDEIAKLEQLNLLNQIIQRPLPASSPARNMQSTGPNSASVLKIAAVLGSLAIIAWWFMSSKQGAEALKVLECMKSYSVSEMPIVGFITGFIPVIGELGCLVALILVVTLVGGWITGVNMSEACNGLGLLPPFLFVFIGCALRWHLYDLVANRK